MDVIRQIEHGVIVSCQAPQGGPLDSPEILAAIARAAELGGAVGIRANLPHNIRAIKSTVGIPVIGIYKKHYDDSPVYITPTFEEVRQVVNSGANIIALDATLRPRPGGLTLARLVEQIRSHTEVPLMADISTFEEAEAANKLGFDLIATTLCGYTPETEHWEVPNLDLVRRIAASIPQPLIVEGRIHRPEQAALMFEAGAHSIVVGTAITDITWVTSQFANAVARKVGSW